MNVQLTTTKTPTARKQNIKESCNIRVFKTQTFIPTTCVSQQQQQWCKYWSVAVSMCNFPLFVTCGVFLHYVANCARVVYIFCCLFSCIIVFCFCCVFICGSCLHFTFKCLPGWLPRWFDSFQPEMCTYQIFVKKNTHTLALAWSHGDFLVFILLLF